MDNRHLWISRRAKELWFLGGTPFGRDLEFWLRAEREYDHKCEMCVLSPGSCPYQQEQPTSGGRHISLCTLPNPTCGKLVKDFNT